MKHLYIKYLNSRIYQIKTYICQVQENKLSSIYLQTYYTCDILAVILEELYLLLKYFFSKTLQKLCLFVVSVSQKEAFCVFKFATNCFTSRSKYDNLLQWNHNISIIWIVQWQDYEYMQYLFFQNKYNFTISAFLKT